MSRPSIDAYWSAMIPLVAARATCPRRSVGAILVDDKGQIVSSAYNGNPAGAAHCIDEPCAGSPIVNGLRDDCAAIHAESNAVAQALGSRRTPCTLYCSVTPCFQCAKLLLAIGVRRVVALECYKHDDRGPAFLTRNGIEVVVLSEAAE
jgi:dCMP deaminase